MKKQLIMMILVWCCLTVATAQDIRYYRLTRKMENGKSSVNVSGGQFITFVSDICYESNNKGFNVGHGEMTRNKYYSTEKYTVYQGSNYWGRDVATFQFNPDRSVLNVVIDKDNYYIYKHATPPAGQETCSLIKKQGGGGGGSNVVIPPTPIVVDPSNPTPSPTPTPTPTPPPTPTSRPEHHKCGLCGGSGEVIENNATSFGNTKYCSKCGKTVPDSHYHKTCPSCGGKGWW